MNGNDERKVVTLDMRGILPCSLGICSSKAIECKNQTSIRLSLIAISNSRLGSDCDREIYDGNERQLGNER